MGKVGLDLGEKFVVFRPDLFGDFHAMVADGVVNHFQPVEDFLFNESLTPEMEANRVKNFFVLTLGKAFLSDFLKLATPLTTRPKPVKVANTIGFNLMPSATAEDMMALPATTLQNRFFLLKTRKSLS